MRYINETSTSKAEGTADHVMLLRLPLPLPLPPLPPLPRSIQLLPGSLADEVSMAAVCLENFNSV